MAQSLSDVLSQIRGGTALYEAGEALAECVKATRDTGKPSKLTFTIKVEPDKTDDTVVTLQPDVDTKLPRRPKAKGIFFVDDKGKLVREDPRQLQMELERKLKLEASNVTALEGIGRGPA